MIQAQIVEIKYGAKVVSLVAEVRKLAGVSLSEAKGMVERAIDGEAVTVEFENAKNLQEFKMLAEGLGAVVR